jgi:predicted small lipoprotein YifL
MKKVLIILSVIILVFSLAACGSGGNPTDADSKKALDELVSETNNTFKEQASDYEGIYIVYAEARGTGTMAIIFQAEDPVFETLEFSETIAEGLAPTYSALPKVMRLGGINDPEIVVEFLSMDGDLILSQEFTM